MATIVPISHSIRWRSRSRNSSVDLLESATHQQQQHDSASASHFPELQGSFDASEYEWDEEPSDDEDALFDELQTSAWLVVPREYANVAQRRRGVASVSPHSGAGYAGAVKSMERRRADSLEN